MILNVSSNKVLKTNRVTARNQDELSFVLPDNGHTWETLNNHLIDPGLWTDVRIFSRASSSRMLPHQIWKNHRFDTVQKFVHFAFIFKIAQVFLLVMVFCACNILLKSVLEGLCHFYLKRSIQWNLRQNFHLKFITHCYGV